MSENVSIPSLIRTLDGPFVNELSDADLYDYLRRGFAPLALVGGEAAGRMRVAGTLNVLLGKVIGVTEPSNPPSPSAHGVPEVTAAVNDILSHGMHASVPWERWLKALSTEDAREVVQIAAMFSLPPELHEPLTRAIGAEDRRAFWLNAAPVTIAKTLVRRAWIGQAPPTWMVFRDQDWPAPGAPDEAVPRVSSAVCQALECTEEEARWLLGNAQVLFFLIFATRPLPEPRYVEMLHEALPGARFFFLMGRQHMEEDRRSYQRLVELPQLPEGAEWRFRDTYKRLMELVDPRNGGAKRRPPTKRTRNAVPARKKAASRPSRPRKKK